MQEAQRRGYIDWVGRGYGFIVDGEKVEYFTHARDVLGVMSDFKKGALVDFTPCPKIEGEERPRARKVLVIK